MALCDGLAPSRIHFLFPAGLPTFSSQELCTRLLPYDYSSATPLNSYQPQVADRVPGAILHRSRNSAITPEQLSDVEYFVEVLKPEVWEVVSMQKGEIIHGKSGIYAFLRTGVECPRIYLGMSEYDLHERIYRQIFERRWSVYVVVFEMSGLHPNILRALEKLLLNRGRQWLPWAIWDNIRLLPPYDSRHATGPFFHPELEELSRVIIRTITNMMPPSKRSSGHQYYAPHLCLGSPPAEVWGRVKRASSWTYLLPGSRVTTKCPNFAAMQRNPAAYAILSKYYWEGYIRWHSATLRRPAGLVVTETIRLTSIAEAAQFLFAGKETTGEWSPV